MRELILWALARRYAVIAIAVIFAPNLSFVSASILALQAAYRGPVVAIGDALLVALGVAFVSLLAGGAREMILTAALALTAGVVVGSAVRKLRSFALSFQGLILLAYLAILVYSLFGSTANPTFDAIMDQFVSMMRDRGLSAGALAELRAAQPRLIGIFGMSIFLDLTTILVLSYWWLCLARSEMSFGAEFRALRIGVVLGVPTIAILVLTLVFDSTLVHNLFGIAACAILIQGLAYVHRRAHAREWHAALLVPVYVVLVPTYLIFSLTTILGVRLT